MTDLFDDPTRGPADGGPTLTRREGCDSPPPLQSVPLDAQIACVRRELAMRRNVYQRRVRGGLMRQDEAERELAAMAAVLGSLVFLTGRFE